jgi:hypothetical protein
MEDCYDKLEEIKVSKCQFHNNHIQFLFMTLKNESHEILGVESHINHIH